MKMIITYRDEETGESHISHGVDIDTGETVILPNEPLEELGYYHAGSGEWMLKES